MHSLIISPFKKCKPCTITATTTPFDQQSSTHLANSVGVREATLVCKLSNGSCQHCCCFFLVLVLLADVIVISLLFKEHRTKAHHHQRRRHRCPHEQHQKQQQCTVVVLLLSFLFNVLLCSAISKFWSVVWLVGPSLCLPFGHTFLFLFVSCVSSFIGGANSNSSKAGSSHTVRKY